MKTKLLASILTCISINALASYNIEPFQMQRAKMDKAITARNQLLNKIGFTGASPDTTVLVSINSAELSVEYTLSALETYLSTLNEIEKPKNHATIDARIADMRSSLASICASQLMEIDAQRDALADPRIKAAVNAQVDNVRTACDMVGGSTTTDGNLRIFY